MHLQNAVVDRCLLMQIMLLIANPFTRRAMSFLTVDQGPKSDSRLVGSLRDFSVKNVMQEKTKAGDWNPQAILTLKERTVRKVCKGEKTTSAFSTGTYCLRKFFHAVIRCRDVYMQDSVSFVKFQGFLQGI